MAAGEHLFDGLCAVLLLAAIQPLATLAAQQDEASSSVHVVVGRDAEAAVAEDGWQTASGRWGPIGTPEASAPAGLSVDTWSEAAARAPVAATLTLGDGASYLALFESAGVAVGGAAASRHAVRLGPGTPVFAEVLLALDRWQRAWSEQDVARYLAAYHPHFDPVVRSRVAWEQVRRQRVSQPAWIAVDIGGVRLRALNNQRVEARFPQHYRSDRYRDDVTKTLVFGPGQGGWQILRERAD